MATKTKTFAISSLFAAMADFLSAHQSETGAVVLAEGDTVDLVGFSSNSYLEFFGVLTDCENNLGQYNDDVLTAAKKCSAFIDQWRVVGYASKNGSLQPVGLQFAATVKTGLKLGKGGVIEGKALASETKLFSNLAELVNNMSNRHSMTYDQAGIKAIDSYHKSYALQAKSLYGKTVTVDELPAIVPCIDKFIALSNLELTNSTSARVSLANAAQFAEIKALVEGLGAENTQRIAFAQLLVHQAVGDTTLSFKNFEAMLALPEAVFASLGFSVSLCWLLPESQAWSYESLITATKTTAEDADENAA